ncbi:MULTISPECIES: hypothetical protein [Methylomonas]|uniref:hypothetical protein n=1 Tax=Methylomonas TaxID=416 RepID=UPI001044A4EC|nr:MULTISPECIES: hypothetical protein [Methylomonas]
MHTRIAADYRSKPSKPETETRQTPLLSSAVDDVLNRYDQTNKTTITKLSATLPLLIGDKPINQILQAGLNGFLIVFNGYR